MKERRNFIKIKASFLSCIPRVKDGEKEKKLILFLNIKTVSRYYYLYIFSIYLLSINLIYVYLKKNEFCIRKKTI